MKTKKLIILALILAFVGCQKDSPLPNLQDPVAQKKDYPVRPDLQPGENSGKLLLKSASITADLNSITAEQLVDALIGAENAPTVTNVTYSGAKNAAGTFAEDDVFGLESGIVLSSGNVAYIQGPNTDPATSQNNGLPGDEDLNTLILNPTYDAFVLEFDIECEYLKVISFQYVFASEEYNEYVNTQFNDVFGFFVNGVNIAVVPGTTNAVSVNNINCGNPYAGTGPNCGLFKNNANLTDYDTEMDGFTTILTATASLNPGSNHVKLAIADAGDRILDANVLIKGGSFVCAPPDLPVPVVIDIKPNNTPNSINCNNVNDLIPVAILTTPDFDAAWVNYETVEFEGAVESHINKKTGLKQQHLEDVDLDGDMDLVFHFLLSETGLDCLSTAGTLTGKLYDGTPIKGADEVRMIDVPATK